MALLILEKAPFVAISIFTSVITFYAQHKAGAVIALESIPLDLRLMNAIVSYTGYIKKMFWPHGLAVFYTYFGAMPLSKVFLSGLIFIVISYLAARQWRKHPYLIVGWLWYIGTLVPVIGIIQVGSQAMADRYSYIPLIGLFIMMAWGVPELLSSWPRKKIFLRIGAATIILVLIICSRTQANVWKNSITLFTHAISVTQKNYLAQSNLGVALMHQGDSEGAINHFSEAIRINPDYAIAHTNLGDALVARGKPDEAIKHFRRSLEIRPDYNRAQRYLADVQLRKGECDEAISLYNKVLQIEPDNPELYNNLGVALACRGKIERAAYYFEKAIRIKPDYTEARNNYKIVMKQIHHDGY